MWFEISTSSSLKGTASCCLPRNIARIAASLPLSNSPRHIYRISSRPNTWKMFYGNPDGAYQMPPFISSLKFCSSTEGSLDRRQFDSICTETLDSLSDHFEELVESTPHLKSADIAYSDGVLTVSLGKKYGTYVINRQTPNSQIWLSSPYSGPKRYDFVNGTWVYKHDRTTLHSLLDKELQHIVEKPAEFVEKCSYAKKEV